MTSLNTTRNISDHQTRNLNLFMSYNSTQPKQTFRASNQTNAADPKQTENNKFLSVLQGEQQTTRHSKKMLLDYLDAWLRKRNLPRLKITASCRLHSLVWPSDNGKHKKKRAGKTTTYSLSNQSRWNGPWGIRKPKSWENQFEQYNTYLWVGTVCEAFQQRNIIGRVMRNAEKTCVGY